MSTLPLNAVNFGCARLKEIEAVKTLLKAQNGTKLAFQKLPRHMRRRVMGHTTKRVPKRIKQIHLNQLTKSGLPPVQKRPSRKYRRRPKLLNSEIARRQMRNKWLETHIWHAKRFHMTTKWSYKIPYKPNDKAFKACYRATMKHCLLQDISYVGCIQLKGKQLILTNNFKKITRANEGLSMEAKAYFTGNREGKTTFYTREQNIPIGSISYHWKPEVDNSNERTIWIWVHAACYDQVLEELVKLFHLAKQPGTARFTAEDGRTELTDLRFELNRFRLTGPLSQAILSKSLKPVDASREIHEWLKRYLDNDERRQTFSDQIDYWNEIKDLQTPALLSPHIVISLIVNDPRYNMPNKRTKAINLDLKSKDILPPNNLSSGAIWNGEIRETVSNSKLSNATINEMRSKLLVPGTELPNQDEQIPIMLIQRPGNIKTGFCAGWDVIIPKSWGQPTWLCFIMWGARAGGYRETESITFEIGQQSLLPPDSPAGVEEDALIDEVNRKRYFALPPNKRTNFNKFTTVSPLCCNWKVLINDWKTNVAIHIETFFVLRDKMVLQDLQMCLSNRKHKVVFNEEHYLIPVKITPKKGNLSRYTMVCMPTKQDQPKIDLVEPIKADVHKQERKTLREEHKSLLQRLKRKRHAERLKGHQVALDKIISDTFLKKMRDLWLPEVASGIRKSACREIMGFIVKGGVSLSNGNCHGIGYVPVTALMQFLSTMKGNQVLIRNTNCRHYRFATIEIIQ